VALIDPVFRHDWLSAKMLFKASGVAVEPLSVDPRRMPGGAWCRVSPTPGRAKAAWAARLVVFAGVCGFAGSS
jgi:hypothetical protein